VQQQHGEQDDGGEAEQRDQRHRRAAGSARG
jgi:hypothetical protein